MDASYTHTASQWAIGLMQGSYGFRKEHRKSGAKVERYDVKYVMTPTDMLIAQDLWILILQQEYGIGTDYGLPLVLYGLIMLRL